MYISTVWLTLTAAAFLILTLWGIWGWHERRIWEALFNELRRIHTRDRMMYALGARYNPPAETQEESPE